MSLNVSTASVLADIANEESLLRGSDDIANVRTTYDRVFSSWTLGASKPTNEKWVSIDLEGKPSTVLMIEPTELDGEKSIVFIHGGGWSLGSALCYAPLARVLAAETGLRVLVPDFPQAPEIPFPAAFDLLHDLIKWVVRETNDKIFLVGDSAGGNLCAALCTKTELRKKVIAQALYYPVLDLTAKTHYASREKYGSGEYFLSKDGIDNAVNWYCSMSEARDNPAISPIFETDFDGFPPTFIFLPEFDPVFDEGIKYSHILKENGVPIEMFIAMGTIHGCISFSGRIPEGQEGIKLTANFFEKWL